MRVYRIRNFSDEFETNESRKLKRLPWIALPTKQEGDGYTELMSGHENGCAHFGAWTAMLQLAAKCSPRGVLIRDLGGRRIPHDAASISRITRVPVDVLTEVLPRLVDIGWMEEVEQSSVTEEIPESAGVPAEGGRKPVAQERRGEGQHSTSQQSGGEESPATPASPVPVDDHLPPPLDEKKIKRRMELLVILKANNCKLEMAGENIFEEWVDESDGFRLDWIEYLLETVRPRIKLPSKLRAELKLRADEYKTWRKK